MAFAWWSASAVAQPPIGERDPVYIGELRFSQAEEALYLERHRKAARRSEAQDLYEPLEAIRGAQPWKPLPIAQLTKRTISQKTLEAASGYAARNNSSALIIWRNGQIELESYFGNTTASTALNSFSLAKPITAIAVGRAIQLGKIRSLDQRVVDFIEEWKGDPRREKILVRHLLDMRGGLLRQADAAAPEEIMARSFLHPRSDEILIREYPVVDEPGTRYEYNNAASDLAAVLIERATGRRYAEFVGTEIFEKLGAQGGQVWVNRVGGVAHGGCCMLLPAETILRVAILMISDGVWNGQRLLPDRFVREMTQGTAENPYFGLGVFVAGRYTERRGTANPDLPAKKTLHSEPYLAADLYLFDGNMNQVVYVIPSQGLVILRTGKAPPRSKEQEWDNAYLPNIVIRGIVKDRRESQPQIRD